MTSLQKKQKAEAIKRLELMNICEDVRRRFEEKGDVMFSEYVGYRVLSDEEKTEVRQFEREHDATVFLGIRLSTMYGTLDAFLFVGEYEEEWEMEREGVLDGYALSYCINRDYPECSEMGSIVFRVTKNGLIVREG